MNSFITDDGVKLACWEAGQGEPLTFVPGWSANGAQYINVMYLLARKYHVYVLDPRNQGLSQKVDYGNRIARHSMDLREFGEHLGLKSASDVGHSMGAAVLWSYIDLFGTSAMRKTDLKVSERAQLTDSPSQANKAARPSQRWAQSVVPGATLFSYTAADQGDHFLMFKNPVKFTQDLQSVLAR